MYQPNIDDEEECITLDNGQTPTPLCGSLMVNLSNKLDSLKSNILGQVEELKETI
jgi:hypothetical protein